jgi:hypothetical protein
VKELLLKKLFFLLFILLVGNIGAENGILRLKSLGFTFPSDEMIPPPLTAFLNEDKIELTNQKKVTVLYFWSSMNPPSLTDLTLLEDLKAELHGSDILIAPVNLNEDRKVALEAARKAGITMDLFLYPDPGNLMAYILRTVPSAYILDSNGYLAASKQGNTDWNHPDMIRSLKELAASGK